MGDPVDLKPYIKSEVIELGSDSSDDDDIIFIAKPRKSPRPAAAPLSLSNPLQAGSSNSISNGRPPPGPGILPVVNGNQSSNGTNPNQRTQDRSHNSSSSSQAAAAVTANTSAGVSAPSADKNRGPASGPQAPSVPGPTGNSQSTSANTSQPAANNASNSNNAPQPSTSGTGQNGSAPVKEPTPEPDSEHLQTEDTDIQVLSKKRGTARGSFHVSPRGGFEVKFPPTQHLPAGTGISINYWTTPTGEAVFSTNPNFPYPSTSSKPERSSASPEKCDAERVKKERLSKDRTASSSKHRERENRSRSRSRSKDRERHSSSKHSERPESSKRRHKSRETPPLFLTPVELIHIINACGKCEEAQTFTKRHTAVTHKRKIHRLQHCPVCFLLLPTTGNDWKDHLVKRHLIGEAEEEQAKCPFCPKHVDFKGMYQHVSIKHLIPEEVDGEVRPDPEGPPVLLPNHPTVPGNLLPSFPLSSPSTRSQSRKRREEEARSQSREPSNSRPKCPPTCKSSRRTETVTRENAQEPQPYLDQDCPVCRHKSKRSRLSNEPPTDSNRTRRESDRSIIDAQTATAAASSVREARRAEPTRLASTSTDPATDSSASNQSGQPANRKLNMQEIACLNTHFYQLALKMTNFDPQGILNKAVLRPIANRLNLDPTVVFDWMRKKVHDYTANLAKSKRTGRNKSAGRGSK